MPRGARLDMPGMLYHIICRGIERGDIFRDDQDRDMFLARLGQILIDTSTTMYAFALIPNHFHLLLQRGGAPISKVMQRLLTGYAVSFNRRHKRAGHLFQNRYKAIICEHDTYFLELVRYIHLNPLRAGLVESLSALNFYPYSGHAFVMGKKNALWYDRTIVLSYFGGSVNEAKRRYFEFVSDGASLGRRAELVGGGLKRSMGYPKEYPKERLAFDERILGSSGFVEALLKTQEATLSSKKVDLDDLLLSACSEFDITEDMLKGTWKAKKIADARAYFAYRAISEAGISGGEIARVLNATSSAVSKMARRGERLAGSIKHAREMS